MYEPHYSLFRKNEVLALGQAGTEFKAPMRGIGVMRRGQQRGRASNRGRDPFRDRAQNTSRPPSMHVDDFVKMATNPSAQVEPQEPERVRNVNVTICGPLSINLLCYWINDIVIIASVYSQRER